MCLGIPGQVVEILDADTGIASVRTEGAVRRVNVSLLQDEGVDVGDWVLVHVGFAMSKIDAEEAAAVHAFLDELQQAAEGRAGLGPA
jgi:hydrogenase expression/formation protein HypC